VNEVSHSGGTAGYRAFLTRYPDYELSVAVMCNTASVNSRQLAHDVAEIYLGDELVPVTESEAISQSREVLERHAGVYRHAVTGAAMEIVVDEGKLRIGDDTLLIPISATSYKVEDSENRFELDLNVEGAVEAARRITPNGDTERYIRKVATTPDAKTLSEYVGRYRSEEAEAEFVAAVEEDKLVLRRRPDDVFELEPAWADAFIAEFGTIVFRRGKGNRVNAMSLSVSRMFDLRFTRVTETNRD
jgi:hypothetical protein